MWDVKNVLPVANYRGHSGRLFCAQWSTTDADVVYTGADDFSVHAWHVSKQEHTVPPKGNIGCFTNTILIDYCNKFNENVNSEKKINCMTGREWSKKKKVKGKSKLAKERETADESASASGESRKLESSNDMETLHALLVAKKKELELQEKLNMEKSDNEKTDQVVISNGKAN